MSAITRRKGKFVLLRGITCSATHHLSADRTGSVSRLSSWLDNLGLMLGISTGVIQNCGEASLLPQRSQNFSLLLSSV